MTMYVYDLMLWALINLTPVLRVDEQRLRRVELKVCILKLVAKVDASKFYFTLTDLMFTICGAELGMEKKGLCCW